MIDLPTCACGEFYGAHHPECPALRAYDDLAAAAARVTCRTCGDSGKVLAATQDNSSHFGRVPSWIDCPDCTPLREILALIK